MHRYDEKKMVFDDRTMHIYFSRVIIFCYRTFEKFCETNAHIHTGTGYFFTGQIIYFMLGSPEYMFIAYCYTDLHFYYH